MLIYIYAATAHRIRVRSFVSQVDLHIVRLEHMHHVRYKKKKQPTAIKQTIFFLVVQTWQKKNRNLMEMWKQLMQTTAII